MKFSKQEETALIVVTAIALKPESFVSLSDIASRHAISLPFLKKIARLLKSNTILLSKEGVAGGYRLSRPPEEISVFSVLSAVGGKTFDDGSFGGASRTCPLDANCIPQKIRNLVTANLISYLNDVTIDQFLKKGRIA
jgi:Rrf2 family protein